MSKLSMSKSQEEIERRSSFYRSEEVKKFLKKNGVPKSKSQMRALIETRYPNADSETIESVGYVHFDVHPQQINIRDKENDKLIISVEK